MVEGLICKKLSLKKASVLLLFADLKANNRNASVQIRER